YTTAQTLVQLVSGFLANGGLSYDDVEGVPVPSVPAGADAFAEGRADTFMFALGSAKVSETDARVGGIRALPIDDSPEAVARLQEVVPVAYPALVEPAQGRAGIKEPTMLYAYDYLVLTGADTSEEVVYNLVKAMHENPEALA